MVLPDRIELSTSPLPMECSTTELRQRARSRGIGPKALLAGRFLPQGPLWCKRGTGSGRREKRQKISAWHPRPALIGRFPGRSGSPSRRHLPAAPSERISTPNSIHFAGFRNLKGSIPPKRLVADMGGKFEPVTKGCTPLSVGRAGTCYAHRCILASHFVLERAGDEER